jgi:hypothetical protein
MKLTDTQLRNAKPIEKAQKLFDGGGLYMLIAPAGGKLWRLDYRFDGKRKTLALGAYPAVSLKDARSRREEAKELLAKDVDPAAYKQTVKSVDEAQKVSKRHFIRICIGLRFLGHIFINQAAFVRQAIC